MPRFLALTFLVQSGFVENECQNLDNCPYNYNNTMDDYMAGAPVEEFHDESDRHLF